MHQVFIVDDDESIRISFGEVIALSGYRVACFDTAEALFNGLHLDSLPDTEVCCVVTDVKMPGTGGIDLMRQLAERKNIGMVLMSGASTLQDVVEAFQSGATRFLLKPIEMPKLLAAIAEALDGAEGRAKSGAVARHFRRAFESLSPQERKVILSVSQGMLNREIADELGIALRTVKLYRHRAIEKLGVDSVPDLVRMLDAFT